MKVVLSIIFSTFLLSVYGQIGRSTPPNQPPRRNMTCGENEQYYRGCGPCERKCETNIPRLPIRPDMNGPRPGQKIPLPIPNNDSGRPDQTIPGINGNRPNNSDQNQGIAIPLNPADRHQNRIPPPINGQRPISPRNTTDLNEQLCAAVCQPEGCYCKPGYYRNDRDRCVRREQCRRPGRLPWNSSDSRDTRNSINDQTNSIESPESSIVV